MGKPVGQTLHQQALGVCATDRQQQETYTK